MTPGSKLQGVNVLENFSTVFGCLHSLYSEENTQRWQDKRGVLSSSEFKCSVRRRWSCGYRKYKNILEKGWSWLMLQKRIDENRGDIGQVGEGQRELFWLPLDGILKLTWSCCFSVLCKGKDSIISSGLLALHPSEHLCLRMCSKLGDQGHLSDCQQANQLIVPIVPQTRKAH